MQVAGASLYLEVRGSDRDAPLLVWVHGGPGGAERPLFELFDSDLERHVRVAYYDQRGAGRSRNPERSSAGLTVARHLADLESVIAYLKADQHVGKVILAGHSWGGLLALLYAERHPDNIAAIVAVSPAIAPLEDQQEQYAFVRSAARMTGDRRALERLERLGAPPLDGTSELQLGKLVDKFGGTWRRRPTFLWAMARAVRGKFIRPSEFLPFIRANELSVRAMTPELLRVDLRSRRSAIKVPVVLFLGRFDHQISTAAALEYIGGLDAPSKSVTWFEASAHNIPFEEPQTFGGCLTRTVQRFATVRLRSTDSSTCPYPSRQIERPVRRSELIPVTRTS